MGSSYTDSSTRADDSANLLLPDGTPVGPAVNGGADFEAADGDGPENELRFLACLPATASPVKMMGDGSLRIVLEVSEQEKPNAVALMALTGRVLEVRIDVAKLDERMEAEGGYGGRATGRTAAKRRKQPGGAGV